MNKLKKVLLILFIFIIAIIAIITLNKTDIISEVVEVAESETLTSSSKTVSSTTSSSHNISSFYNGTVTINGTSYKYKTNGFNFLASNWWVLCSSEGDSLKSVTLYFGSSTSSNKVSPAEAYVLAYLSSNNTSYRGAGQIAWWNIGSGSHATISASYSDSDAAETDIENFISGRDSDFTVAKFSISASDLADGGDLSSYLSSILDYMKNDSSSGYSSGWSDSQKRTNAAAYATQKVKSITTSNLSSYEGTIWYYLIIWGMQQQGYDADYSAEEMTSLYGSAANFQTYIFEIFGTNSVSGLSYTTYNVDGTTVNGFDIDEKVEASFKFVDTDTEVSVNFTQEADSGGDDANSFIVGPFKLGDYVYNSEFSYISSSSLQLLYSDGSTSDILTYKTDYHFETTEIDGLDSNGYPKPGKEFYVVFEYDENISGIANLGFVLTYMNGAGSFTTYSTWQWYCSYCGTWLDTYHAHCSFWPACDYTTETSIDSSSASSEFASHTHCYCEHCGEWDVEWECWDSSASYETNEANLSHYYCEVCEEEGFSKSGGGTYCYASEHTHYRCHKCGEIDDERTHYYCEKCDACFTERHTHYICAVCDEVDDDMAHRYCHYCGEHFTSYTSSHAHYWCVYDCEGRSSSGRRSCTRFVLQFCHYN